MRHLLTALTTATVSVLAASLLVAAPAHADVAAPLVGTCHGYTNKQAEKRSDTSAPVDCAGSHTAVTIAVPTVGKIVSTKTKKSQKALLKGDKTCVRASEEAIGAALPQTTVAIRYFLPTKAETKAGARWLRCDLVLEAGRDLAPLPTPLVSAPLTDAVARCGVVLKKVVVKTICAAPHDYRYSGQFKAKGGRYPGYDRLLRTAILGCADKVDNPKRFYSFFPSEFLWGIGERVVTCLSATKS